jgi:hypothetical protein
MTNYYKRTALAAVALAFCAFAPVGSHATTLPLDYAMSGGSLFATFDGTTDIRVKHTVLGIERVRVFSGKVDGAISWDFIPPSTLTADTTATGEATATQTGTFTRRAGILNVTFDQGVLDLLGFALDISLGSADSPRGAPGFEWWESDDPYAGGDIALDGFAALYLQSFSRLFRSFVLPQPIPVPADLTVINDGGGSVATVVVDSQTQYDIKPHLYDGLNGLLSDLDGDCYLRGGPVLGICFARIDSIRFFDPAGDDPPNYSTVDLIGMELNGRNAIPLPPPAVPLPAGFVLLGSGAALLGLLRRRRGAA